MADFYADMATMVKSLLGPTSGGGLGQQGVELVRRPAALPSGERFDMPTMAAATKETLKAAVSGVAAKYVDGSRILATDLSITCAIPAMGFDSDSDTILVDGKPVTIIEWKSVPAAGVKVAMKFIVRQ